MWKAVLAGTTALAIAGSSIVFAQQRPAGTEPEQHWRPSAQDFGALADADEGSARRLVETMALALQGTLLDRHGDPAVAAAFRAREPYGAFGTLPTGLPFGAILERHRP